MTKRHGFGKQRKSRANADKDYHLSRTAGAEDAEDAAQIILIFDKCQPLCEVGHYLLPLSYRVGIEIQSTSKYYKIPAK